ncbi:MAG: phospholipase D family protein [Lysobacteraceae bacterium]|nr:MAG: phospholipase D family protein [Xanthomonadaceae bacterium]
MPIPTRWTRIRRIAAWGAFSLFALIGSGLLLADRFTPAANGEAGVTPPIEADATALDRELAPLLAQHPGQTGVLMLPNGLDAFAARAVSARRAGRSLDLMYYIWHDDLTGRLLAREAWDAAERGVRVRILIDDINAESLDQKLLLLDWHRNIELRLYNPFRNREGAGRIVEMTQRIFSLNHRMHNKAWIADGRVAVVGGRNIGVEYFDASEEVNFRDLDLVLFGPAVAEASAVFDRYWNSTSVVPLAALAQATSADRKATMAWVAGAIPEAEAKRYLARVEGSHNVRDYGQQQLSPIWTRGLHVIADPPDKARKDPGEDWLIKRIIRDLDGAQRKALVISPYFVPGDDGATALSALARRGVRVGVVTNSLAANDVPAVYGAYRRYREPLLAAGVRLYELRAQGHVHSANFGASDASLHTKAYVVDDRRGFIGSFNLDPRSAWLNTEMGVVFDDLALASELRTEYLRLAGPELSYWMHRRENGDVLWLDRMAQPPALLSTEPDTDAMQRIGARVMAMLPVESQL